MDITSNKDVISTGKEKEALEFILEHSFKSGFGTLNKSELDLVLFTAILKFSNQRTHSDFALSKYLQITQQRVRALKEKASVKYPYISIEEAILYFVEQTKHAKPDDKYIDIPISDIAVRNEIEAIMEENNLMEHSQLNPKIFRVRIDDFFELAITFELKLRDTDKRKDIEKRLITELKSKLKDEEDLKKKLLGDKGSLSNLTMQKFKEGLIKGGLHFGVDALASLIPGGAFLSGPVKKLMDAIQDKV